MGAQAHSALSLDPPLTLLPWAAPLQYSHCMVQNVTIVGKRNILMENARPDMLCVGGTCLKKGHIAIVCASNPVGTASEQKGATATL